MDEVDESNVEDYAESLVPSMGGSKYRDAFYEKGFDDEEMTALSYVFAYGKVCERGHAVRTNFDKFDNQLYKDILSSTPTGIVGLDEILRDDDLKVYVEQFAESKEEFFKTFLEAH